MRVEIKRLQRSLGTTSVYVTHDQLEAMTLADRLVVLNGGNIEQIGAPIDVYDKPASTFVASFIGSPAMNLLKVKADGNGLALATGTGLKGANAKGRDAYTIGIRPEHLEVVTAPGEGEGLHLEASVNVLEPVGAESYLYSSFADGGDEILVRVSSHARHEPGEKLYLRAAPENVHYFDAETGRRID
jgi:sn-glycerol 3-phosphate transport system ATP-binding protein